MFYIDTSAIVALLTEEVATPRVEAWFSSMRPPFLSSDWTLTETFSALSIKRRTGKISAEKHEAATRELRTMLGASFKQLPVKRRHSHAAASHCARHNLNLRSGDTLHLAVALDIGAEIITIDRRFATATTALGGR